MPTVSCGKRTQSKRSKQSVPSAANRARYPRTPQGAAEVRREAPWISLLAMNRDLGSASGEDKASVGHVSHRVGVWTFVWPLLTFPPTSRAASLLRGIPAPTRRAKRPSIRGSTTPNRSWRPPPAETSDSARGRLSHPLFSGPQSSGGCLTSGRALVTLRAWKRTLSASHSGPTPRRAKSDFPISGSGVAYRRSCPGYRDGIMDLTMVCVVAYTASTF